MVIKKNKSDFLHENWQPGSVYILDLVTVTGVLCVCTFICVHARQTHVQQVRELGGGSLPTIWVLGTDLPAEPSLWPWLRFQKVSPCSVYMTCPLPSLNSVVVIPSLRGGIPFSEALVISKGSFQTNILCSGLLFFGKSFSPTRSRKLTVSVSGLRAQTMLETLANMVSFTFQAQKNSEP